MSEVTTTQAVANFFIVIGVITTVAAIVLPLCDWVGKQLDAWKDRRDDRKWAKLTHPAAWSKNADWLTGEKAA